MPGTTGPRRTARFRLALVVLYAFVLSASAFFHHDFACRQDSRIHCISCSVGQDAQQVESHGGPLDANQRLAGRVDLLADAGVDIPSLHLLSDRAPPRQTVPDTVARS